MSIKIDNEESGSQSKKAKSYVVSTLFNTSLFVMMSVVTKVINLVFHVLIARIISKESYGLATVYFNFIFSILLYFPRETLRKTCLKYCTDEKEERENCKFKEICHLIWLLNVFVILSSIPISFIFIFYGGSGESKISEYKIHIFLHILAAIIELIGEPVLIYMSIKLDKKYRLIAMTLSNYSRLIFNFLLAACFGLDIWSFTLSRLFASFLFFLYLAYIGLFIYKFEFSIFLPNFLEMFKIAKNLEVRAILNSFLKGTTIKMILNYTERVVLSFFLEINDSSKGEYTFIVENFATFIRFIIEPADENFYNLINKIKHYKELSLIPSNDDFTGDFSKNENEILNKLYSNFNNNKNKDKENYSFKLLKLSLKLFFVFGILLYCYIYIIGKDFLIYVFTEKWGTEHTNSIMRVYSLYIGVLAVTSIIESYSNAICSNTRMNTLNTLMVFNACILLVLSILFARYDITGLVWANIVTLVMRFFINTYIIITTELEDQLFKHNKQTQFDVGQFISQNCVKLTNIFSEIVKFLHKSFMKTAAIVSTCVCLIILSLIKDLLKVDKESRLLLLISTGIILSLNILLIFMVEKKGFIEIVRLKSSALRE